MSDQYLTSVWPVLTELPVLYTKIWSFSDDEKFIAVLTQAEQIKAELNEKLSTKGVEAIIAQSKLRNVTTLTSNRLKYVLCQ